MWKWRRDRVSLVSSRYAGFVCVRQGLFHCLCPVQAAVSDTQQRIRACLWIVIRHIHGTPLHSWTPAVVWVVGALVSRVYISWMTSTGSEAISLNGRLPCACAVSYLPPTRTQ